MLFLYNIQRVSIEENKDYSSRMSQEIHKVSIPIPGGFRDTYDQILPQCTSSPQMISTIRETPLYILRNTMRRHSPRKDDIALDSDSKKPWNEEEELRLILAHKQFKNRWADVADAMKGRSGNNIKNKFYSIFRKVKGKIAKNDYSYTSQLELLEIRYMSTLMLHYLAHPIVRVKTKGKRGKDFIYSLICNLSLDSVNNYSKCLSDMTKAKGNLEELFDTLEKQILSKTSCYAKSNSKQNIKEETKDISQEYALKRPKKEDESFLNLPSLNQRLRNIEPWETHLCFQMWATLCHMLSHQPAR